MHARHGGPAIHKVHDRVIECTGARLAGHAVSAGPHVGLTREGGEEQMAAHLSESAQRDQRPYRRTKFDGRSEDQSCGARKDPCAHDGESAATRRVTGHRESSSQHAQGGSGCSTRHTDSVAPRQGAIGART